MLDSLDDRRLMFGLPFGYPKVEDPVNEYVTDLALFGDLVTMHDRRALTKSPRDTLCFESIAVC